MDQCAYNALKKCLSSAYRPLVPLKTKGDGNCLVHATCMEEYGRDDVGYTLRKELHEFLLHASRAFKHQWKSQETIWAAECGFSLNDSQLDSEWQSVIDLASAEISGDNTRLPLQSLENTHVFALANILKRTIIVVADHFHYINGESYSPERFGGIYLPHLNHPNDCNKYPIIIGYSNGHFNAMTTSTEKGKMLFPLKDSNDDLLPLQFCDPGMNENEKMRFLKRYLNVQLVKKTGGKSDLCVKYKQLIPKMPSGQMPSQVVENEDDSIGLIYPAANMDNEQESG